MSVIDALASVFINRQKNKINQKNRGVTHYRPAQLGAFVELDAYSRNTVLSGGTDALRAEGIEQLCVSAANAGVPVILLHSGDVEAERLLSVTFAGHPIYRAVSAASPALDLFSGISYGEIGDLLADAAPVSDGINATAASYIDALSEFAYMKNHVTPSLTTFASCPFQRFPTLLANAPFPPAVISSIQQNLTAGQSERRGVERYLRALLNECAALLPPKGSLPRQSVGIADAVRRGSVLSIDVISDGNIRLIRLLAQEMQNLANGGHSFLLILDGLRVTDDKLAALLSTKTAGFRFVLSTSDPCTAFGGDDKRFDATTSGADKWFVFHHMGTGAEWWSNRFGSYEKLQQTSGTGYHVGGPSGMHFRDDYTPVSERIIRPEEIARLGNRGGFVYTSANREIAAVEQFIPHTP